MRGEQDRNGDGYVSNQEYYVSLYNKVNPDPETLYRGSSPIRNRPPPRASIGP